jgi:hypothetical protein
MKLTEEQIMIAMVWWLNRITDKAPRFYYDYSYPEIAEEPTGKKCIRLVRIEFFKYYLNCLLHDVSKENLITDDFCLTYDENDTKNILYQALYLSHLSPAFVPRNTKMIFKDDSVYVSMYGNEYIRITEADE